MAAPGRRTSSLGLAADGTLDGTLTRRSARGAPITRLQLHSSAPNLGHQQHDGAWVLACHDGGRRCSTTGDRGGRFRCRRRGSFTLFARSGGTELAACDPDADGKLSRTGRRRPPSCPPPDRPSIRSRTTARFATASPGNLALGADGALDGTFTVYYRRQAVVHHARAAAEQRPALDTDGTTSAGPGVAATLDGGS